MFQDKTRDVHVYMCESQAVNAPASSVAGTRRRELCCTTSLPLDLLERSEVLLGRLARSLAGPALVVAAGG